MNRFRPIDRKTDYLLPPSLDDWLPEDHLARFILETIERLDLSTLTRVYGGRGSAAYHPEVLLSLLVYGYVTAPFPAARLSAPLTSRSPFATSQPAATPITTPWPASSTSWSTSSSRCWSWRGK